MSNKHVYYIYGITGYEKHAEIQTMLLPEQDAYKKAHLDLRIRSTRAKIEHAEEDGDLEHALREELDGLIVKSNDITGRMKRTFNVEKNEYNVGEILEKEPMTIQES